jgi:hypothetical protein
MGPIRGGGGGSPRGSPSFLGGGLQNLTVPLLGNINSIIGILLSPVDWHPF